MREEITCWSHLGFKGLSNIYFPFASIIIKRVESMFNSWLFEASNVHEKIKCI